MNHEAGRLLTLVLSTIAFYGIYVYAKRFLGQNGYCEGFMLKLVAFLCAFIGSTVLAYGIDSVQDSFKSPEEKAEQQAEEQQLRDLLKQVQSQ